MITRGSSTRKLLALPLQRTFRSHATNWSRPLRRYRVRTSNPIFFSTRWADASDADAYRRIVYQHTTPSSGQTHTFGTPDLPGLFPAPLGSIAPACHEWLAERVSQQVDSNRLQRHPVFSDGHVHLFGSCSRPQGTAKTTQVSPEKLQDQQLQRITRCRRVEGLTAGTASRDGPCTG